MHIKGTPFKTMKLFDKDFFIEIAITAVQAEDIARQADEVVRKNGIVLYGRYENGTYFDFGSKQQPGHTHCLIGLVPKRLRPANS